MKRFQDIFSSHLPLPQPSGLSSVTGWGVAFVGAMATSILSPSTASAAILDWANPAIEWPSGSLSLQEEYVVDGVTVRMTWTGDTGTFTTLTDDQNTLSQFTGGFTSDILKILFDPDQRSQSVTLTIEYLDDAGNPVPVENARLIVLDIDRDDENQWQDQVTVSGSLGGVATNLTLFSAITGQTAPTPPTTTPTVAAGDYTVDINTLAPTTTGQGTGIYPTNNPNPVPPAPDAEANNDTAEGNIVVDYNSAVDQTVLTFGNGPDSPPPSGTPATDDPAEHGIGLFNVFFQPAIIGVAKQAGTPTQNPDGTFTIPYTVVVENLGEVDLDDVQVTENLTGTFAAANGFTVSNPRIVASPGGFGGSINGGFNGNTSTTLLAGSAAARTLAPSETLTLAFDVTVTPGAGAGGYGPFNNNVTATGQSPSGATVTDESDDGADPDPDGNGSPTENDPTVVNLPAIGVAKRVINIQDVGGTPNPDDIDITYEVVVENFGNEPLNNVQLVEDLIDPTTGNPTFGAGNFTIAAGPTVTAGAGTLTANGGFNGTTDTNLLDAANSTLAVGASGTVQITVRVTDSNSSPPLPSDPPALFRNQVAASGVGANSGGNVSDLSDNGADADEDNDGNPNNNNTPTPVRLPPTPAIGVAKRVVSATAAPGGAFGGDTIRVVYEIVVENIGGETLNNVQLSEDLTPTFGGGSFQVQTLQQTAGANTININGGFDGSATPELLVAATSTLDIGESATLQLTVDVDQTSNTLPSPLPGPFENQVEADGIGEFTSTPVDDLSNDGTQAAIDPNGNANANEPDENIPTPVLFVGDLQLVKRITNVFRNGAPLSAAAIGGDPSAVINGPGADDDDLIAASGGQLPVGLLSVPTNLLSGDQVEYTIYFFNDGALAVNDVQLCDELEPPSIFVPGSLELSAPVALPGPLGAFGASGLLDTRNPLAPLEPSCINAPGAFPTGPPGPTDTTIGVGAGGGVILGGTGFTVDSNNVGALRFRITLP